MNALTTSRPLFLKIALLAVLLTAGAPLTAHAQSAQGCLKPHADKGTNGMFDMIYKWLTTTHKEDLHKDWQTPDNQTAFNKSAGDVTDAITKYASANGTEGGLMSMVSSFFGSENGQPTITGASMTGSGQSGGQGSCNGIAKVGQFQWVTQNG